MNGFLAVLKKEAVQMIRDKGALRLTLLVPAFQLVLFGLIDTNVKHVRTVVLDLSRTEESRQLVRDFTNTSLFDVIEFVPSREVLRDRIVAARASVGIEIPPDYARRRLNRLPADFLVMVDGSDSSIASQALAAANGVTLSRSIAELLMRGGGRAHGARRLGERRGAAARLAPTAPRESPRAPRGVAAANAAGRAH